MGRHLLLRVTQLVVFSVPRGRVILVDQRAADGLKVADPSLAR